MSYRKAGLAALAVGTMAFTIVAMGAFVAWGSVGSIAQFLGLTFNTLWMVALGATPFIFIWILAVHTLELRFGWGTNPLAWILLALVISIPADLFVVSLTNMGDPAPGIEKRWSWDALWPSIVGTVFGALAGWWCHRRDKEPEQLEAAGAE